MGGRGRGAPGGGEGEGGFNSSLGSQIWAESKKKIQFKFGRIRQTNSNSRIRITPEPYGEVNRIRRVRGEFKSRSRIWEFGLIPCSGCKSGYGAVEERLGGGS